MNDWDVSPSPRRNLGDLPAGPFDTVPFELQARLGEPVLRLDDEAIQEHAEAWLLEVLATAEVDVGHYDREVARVIAEEGSTLVHVVAGWVSRANP